MSSYSEMKVIYLKINSETVPLKVIEQSEFTSKHTGKTLEKVTVQTVVRNRQSHDIVAALREKAAIEGITSTDDKGNVQKKWKTTKSDEPHSYMCKESDGVIVDEKYMHTFELKEFEELNIKELVVDGLVLKPYSYEEEVVRGGLVAQAKAAVTKKQETKLRSVTEKGDYVSVTRLGISEEPKKMKIYALRWSEHKGMNKYELSFREGVVDEGSTDALDIGHVGSTTDLGDAIVAGFDGVYRTLMPPLVQTSFMAAENKEKVDWLIDILSRKGVLEPNEIEELRVQVRENMSERKFDFSRVPDIDNRDKRFKWSELR